MLFLLLVYLHTPLYPLPPHCMRYVNGAPRMVECRFRRKYEKVRHICKISSLKESW